MGPTFARLESKGRRTLVATDGVLGFWVIPNRTLK